jgi:O-antigen ligase
MIRLSLLALFVSGFSLYAFRDWFKSLCALILLMAVVEHPDMPKTILGIQGLNPWNLLLLAVVAAWAKHRGEEGFKWDLPVHISAVLLLYLTVILVGFARMMTDRSYLDDSPLSLTSEYLINTVKWVIPGILLYDGCRTRERFRLGIICVLGVYVLLGIQVIKWMPLNFAISGDSLSERSLKILVNEVGFHRVNISAMLAGATWAVFASRILGETSKQRLYILLASGLLVFAQALTAGRAGYVTSALVGCVLCAIKWRRYLLVAPLAVVAVLIIAPGVAERMFEGFTSGTQAVPTRVRALVGDSAGANVYTITAGRNLIWPFVIDKISEAPWLGQGRLAMVRTGLASFLATELDEGFSHPHNGYLELLFDNGIIGAIPVLAFFAMVLWYSFRLFMDNRNRICVGVGGATLAFVLALLFASMGSQSFYPREGWLGMWCLIFLMFRVRVQHALVVAQAGYLQHESAPVNAVGRGGVPAFVPQPAMANRSAKAALQRRLASVRPPFDDNLLWEVSPVAAPRQLVRSVRARDPVMREPRQVRSSVRAITKRPNASHAG